MTDQQSPEPGGGATEHNYRHSITGKIARMTEDQASPFLDYLELVSDDAKPFEPGLFKPGKVGEFKNPEPLTDDQIAAQEALESTLEDHSPRSKAAREAKAAKEAADDAAALAQAQADEAAAAAAAADSKAEGQ